MNKSEIRNKCRKMRAQMNKDEIEEKSLKITELFLASTLYENANSIMLYMPIGNETDTGEIIKKSHMDGKKVIFPVTDSEYKIIPCYADRNTEFKASALSVREPIKMQLADFHSIDVVIVPGVAFDKSGNRIGFGKGCYDRFLSDINAVKVGICYEFQLYDKIPMDANDVKMDYIITENGINKEEA